MDLASRLVLGTVQLGLPYGVSNLSGQPSREEAFRILDMALREDVLTWDTARAYGESESVIGEFLRERKPSFPVRLITKIPSLRAAGPDAVKRHLDASTEALGRRPDAVLFHDEADLAGVFGDANFRALCDERVPAGFSTYDPAVAEPLVMRLPIALLQAPAHLLDSRFLSPSFLDLLEARGTELHLRSVFLQGLFFLDADALPGKMAFAVPTLGKLARIAKETGVSLPELALAYVSLKSRSAKLVIGTNSALEFAGVLKMRGILSSTKLPALESLEKDLTLIREDQDARTASPALWPKS